MLRLIAALLFLAVLSVPARADLIRADLVQGPFLSRADPFQAGLLRELSQLLHDPERLAAALDDADRKVIARSGEDSRAYVSFLSETLIEMRLARGVDAMVSRGRKAVALERLITANGDLWGAYAEVQPSAFLLAGQAEAAGRALDAVMEAHAEGEAGLEPAIFEFAQASFIGGMALSRVHHQRNDPAVPLSSRAREAYVYETRKTMHATALARRMLAAGVVASSPQAEAEAKSSIAQYEDVIATALAQLNDAAVDPASVMLPQPISIGMAQAGLEDDELLIVAVPGATHYHVVTVSDASGLKAYTAPAPWTAIWERTSAVRAEMGVRDTRGFSAVEEPAAQPEQLLADCHWLYQQVLAGTAAERAGKRHIIFASTGALSKLPLEMFVVDPPQPTTTFADAHWLVRDFSVTNITDLEILANPSPLQPDQLYYAGFGAPDYMADAAVKLRGPLTKLIETLPPLPETGTEVKEVAAQLGANTAIAFTGKDFSEYALLELSRSGILRRMQVLHFATHGMTAGDTDDVFEPMLAVTPGNLLLPPLGSITVDALLSPKGDGAFEASEIASLDLAAHLVILSACNSAAAAPFETNGLSGLAGAFFEAGAANVVATHWPVNSAAAVEIVTEMFRADPRLEDIPGALRLAVLAVIAKGGYRSHPQYWAPFSHIGQP